MPKIYPVILSGGSGTRLWPLSREQYPKQFLRLCDDQYSMFQLTVKRVLNKDLFHPPLIIANENHRFLILNQLKELEVEPLDIILEPIGRNTLASDTIAAFRLAKEDPDSVFVTFPSDHYMENLDEFDRSMRLGLIPALENKISLFGIKPNSPHTGYGYIKTGAAYSDQTQDTYQISAFVEKPNTEKATEFLKDGHYFWSTGILMMKSQKALDEVKRLEPEVYQHCYDSFKNLYKSHEFWNLPKDPFEKNINQSFDYSILERTKDVALVTPSYVWNDVGSWSALWEVRAKDENQNVVEGNVHLFDVKNSYLHSRDQILAAMGVENLIIIALKDAVLVADKTKAESVKQLVEYLKSNHPEQITFHHKVHRPWGFYETINMGNRFLVKRIQVKPKGSLSLQKHHHRAEHWVVVNGTAQITRGNEVFLLSENESTFIPLGVMHRLENPGIIPLNLIEVQSGAYLKEDDIERFEDIYGREEKKQPSQASCPHSSASKN